MGGVTSAAEYFQIVMMVLELVTPGACRTGTRPNFCVKKVAYFSCQRGCGRRRFGEFFDAAHCAPLIA